MKQKKAEKEQGIARMIRLKHAVLVIQVGSAATLQWAVVSTVVFTSYTREICHPACDESRETLRMAATHLGHVYLLCADGVSAPLSCSVLGAHACRSVPAGPWP